MDKLPKEYRDLINFLRSHPSAALTEGVVAERRVDVFRGSAITSLLLADNVKAKFPSLGITEKRDAHNVLQDILDAGVFLQVTQSNGRYYQPSMNKRWSDEADYAWVYQGSNVFHILVGISIIVGIMLLFMYPLWPSFMKAIGWYVTMALGAFVGFIIVTSIIRLIVFVISTAACKRGLWIFPNLFADVGFIESFIPLYSWNE